MCKTDKAIIKKTILQNDTLESASLTAIHFEADTKLEDILPVQSEICVPL